MPGGELERVLGDIFPEQSRAGGGSLGDVDPALVANVQQDPGLTYQGGPQSQRGGPAGAVAQAYGNWLDAIYGGVDPKNCPPVLGPDCLAVLSRFLEATFRNFQLNSRPPSHIEPPFPARCIDCFQEVTIPGILPYGTAPEGEFTRVCCFQLPPGKWRGVINDFGHALESLEAWADVEWRVTVNGQPHEPYVGIRTQLWHMIEHSKSCKVHLLPQDTVCLEARSLSGADHTAFVRISGWYYPVRSESGGGREIRATLVD